MYELVGYRDVDIEESGQKPVHGVSCWFLMDDPSDSDFHGRSGVKVYFGKERFPDFQPELNRKYMLNFNQKGKLVGYGLMD